jgi:hypothetical protein
LSVKVLLFSLLLPLQSFALFQVVDKGEVLKGLSEWSPGQSYSSLVCRESFAYQADMTTCQVKCFNSYCMSKCDRVHQPGAVRFQLTADECTESGFFVFGDNGLSIEVTKEQYEKDSNLWLMPFLQNIGHFIQPDGIVEMKNYSFRTADYIADGKKTTLRIALVMGEIKYPGAAAGLGFELWLAPSLAGPRQIVMFRLGHDDIFLQLRGLIKGQF